MPWHVCRGSLSLISKRVDSGAISMKEYNDRIEQIDKIAGGMLEFQGKRVK